MARPPRAGRRRDRRVVPAGGPAVRDRAGDPARVRAPAAALLGGAVQLLPRLPDVAELDHAPRRRAGAGQRGGRRRSCSGGWSRPSRSCRARARRRRRAARRGRRGRRRQAARAAAARDDPAVRREPDQRRHLADALQGRARGRRDRGLGARRGVRIFALAVAAGVAVGLGSGGWCTWSGCASTTPSWRPRSGCSPRSPRTGWPRTCTGRGCSRSSPPGSTWGTPPRGPATRRGSTRSPSGPPSTWCSSRSRSRSSACSCPGWSATSSSPTRGCGTGSALSLVVLLVADARATGLHLPHRALRPPAPARQPPTTEGLVVPARVGRRVVGRHARRGDARGGRGDPGDQQRGAVPRARDPAARGLHRGHRHAAHPGPHAALGHPAAGRRVRRRDRARTPRRRLRSGWPPPTRCTTCSSVSARTGAGTSGPSGRASSSTSCPPSGGRATAAAVMLDPVLRRGAACPTSSRPSAGVSGAIREVSPAKVPTPEEGLRTQRLRREIVAAQREVLMERRDSGELDEAVMRRMMRELDLEDESLSSSWVTRTCRRGLCTVARPDTRDLCLYRALAARSVTSKTSATPAFDKEPHRDRHGPRHPQEHPSQASKAPADSRARTLTQPLSKTQAALDARRDRRAGRRGRPRLSPSTRTSRRRTSTGW